MPVVFGSGRLDLLDRRILEIICAHGRGGQSFNWLVTEAEPFASSSTFALRAKRLVKLNYIERFPDGKNKQIVRMRGRPMMLLLTKIASTMRSQCAELEHIIQERAESISAKKTLSEAEVSTEVEFANSMNDEVKGIFSLIGAYAVNIGESAAGDIILPMVMEDLRKLNSAYASLLAASPQLLHSLADRKLANVPLAELRDAFKYAFGTEMDEALPKFSRHLMRLHGNV